MAPLLAFEQAIANSLARRSDIATLPFNKRDAFEKHKEGLALLLSEKFGENVSIFAIHDDMVPNLTYNIISNIAPRLVILSA